MVAVTFEVVSLRTNTLSESVFSQLKTFLELFFWNALQDGRRHVPECWQCLKICGPSKRSSVLGIAKSRTGPYLANMEDGPFHYRFFGPIFPDIQRVMSKGIVMMQDPSIRPKFRSSPTNSLT
jgi:hypothetical protein